MSSRPLPLPISDVIEVNVAVTGGFVAPLPFNQGLIVGPSAVIPSYGANARIRQYASTAAMLLDGFSDDDPEFIAAELYFSQSPAPQFVWIGRQDLTAIKTIIPHSGNAGTGYAVGDTITPTQMGGSSALIKVLAVTAGAVTSLGTTVGNQGTGYADATALATTTSGSGTGLEVDITAVGESYLQAVEAISLLGEPWYQFMCCNATDADNLALALLSSANWQTMLYFGSSNDAAIPAGTTGNIFLQMQALNDRALMIYATSQAGAEFPNNLYAAAAVMGLACGLNTGAPGSAFTLNFKTVSGIAPEPLTQAQYMAILGAGGNAVVTIGGFSGIFSNGQLESGEFFDQILDRAMLVNLIQVNLMNLLTSVPKIPQTDAGEQQLIAQVDDACAAIAAIGYIAPGTWEGPNILTGLKTGQAMPSGFVNQAPPFNSQSSGDRAARKAMPIYCAILEAGAVDSVVVNVNVEL